MRILLTILMLSSLAGCGRVLDFRPTMASDMPVVGLEGSVLRNELLRAYEAVPGSTADDYGTSPYRPAARFSDDDAVSARLCDRLEPSYHERAGEPFNRYMQAGRTRPGFTCLRFKTASQEEATRYLGAGFALTDLYCDIFFERVSQRAAKRRFGRTATNDVGAAMSAVLGLAGMPGGITGGIGAGFGLADSTWRNYDDSFLVAIDLPALQKLVRAEQLRLRSELRTGTDAQGKPVHRPTSYAEAQIEILRYANTCSFSGMRGLLNKAVVEQAGAATSFTAIDAAVQRAMNTARQARAARKPRIAVDTDGVSSDTGAVTAGSDERR